MDGEAGMTTAPDLFGHDTTRWQDQSIPMVRRRQARKLMAKVEALALDTTPGFPDYAKRVERYAKSIGAHSVARAVRWYATPEALSRHGYDAMTARLERVAHAYLARQEAL